MAPRAITYDYNNILYFTIRTRRILSLFLYGNTNVECPECAFNHFIAYFYVIYFFGRAM